MQLPVETDDVLEVARLSLTEHARSVTSAGSSRQAARSALFVARPDHLSSNLQPAKAPPGRSDTWA